LRRENEEWRGQFIGEKEGTWQLKCEDFGKKGKRVLTFAPEMRK